MPRFSLLVSMAVLFIAQTASADVQITNRSSLLMTVVDFGYVGSVTTSVDSLVYTSIDDAQLMRQGSASDGGPIGDVSWDASYQFNLDQQLDLGSAQGFSASCGVGLFAFFAGDGVSMLSSTNRLEVDFVNSTPTDFDLSILTSPYSRLDLQQMTSPGVWETVFSNPAGEYGELSSKLPLDAGEFHLMVESVVDTANGSSGDSWSFSIRAVPEPSSIVLLLIGTPWLLRRFAQTHRVTRRCR